MKPICPGPPFCGGGPSCPQHGDATVQIQTDPPTPVAYDHECCEPSDHSRRGCVNEIRFRESMPTPARCAKAMWWNHDGTVKSRCGRTDCDHPPGADAGTSPPAPDLINDPPHYRSVCGVTIKSGQRILAGDLEAIDVSDAFDLDRYMANVIKYSLRAGRKGASIEDLRKARAYLDRKIARAERGE